MRTIFKGMVLLLAGASFVACSKDVSVDENALKQAEQEAQIAKKFATYQSDFVKAFGSVASGHKWGFDQTTGSATRAALTSTDEYWYIPENLSDGSENKEGWNANDLNTLFLNKGKEGGILSTLSGFNFNNYFLQHTEKVQGGNVKHSIVALEAYNSNTGKWETVTGFEGGDNPDGTFTVTAQQTYFYAPVYTSAAGTTLMTDMGGKANGDGHLFRLVMKEDKHSEEISYNYDYGFLRANVYHKGLQKTIENEAYLAFQLPAKNKNSDPSYWVIRLGEATKATNPVLAEGRVLCEDMGANDFDFNDVVFDAKIMRTGEIQIQVLAHGGILPIAIDGQEVTLDKMTNTGINEDEIQNITIPAVNGQPKYSKIEEIPVTVDPNGTAGPTYNLEAKVGDAPQKICAPIGTLWPKEYTKINLAYTPFDTWVYNATPAQWTGAMNYDNVIHF